MLFQIFFALLAATVFYSGSAEQPNPQPEIKNFEDCVAAGNPVMESYPAQCQAGGRVFVEKIPKEDEPTDGCGDGVCAEITCQAIGCPMPETAENCPQDCAQ